MAAWAFFLLGVSAAPPVAQHPQPLTHIGGQPAIEPQLKIERTSFALPVLDYRTPAGTWKHGKGMLIARDVAPNATLGVGFYRLKPKSSENGTSVPLGGKSKKVAVGLSLRF